MNKVMKKYKVLFCDLDGTLIDTLSGETFPKGIWDMKFKFNVLDAIKRLEPEYICIVSNQGGIERGFVNEDDFRDKFCYVIAAVGEYCNIDCLKRYGGYCISNNKNNPDRKPNIGILKSMWTVDNINNICTKSDCLMIGDESGLEEQFSDSDKKTAENFGIDYMDINDFVKQYKE